jgi:hypothetical protein
MPKIAPIGFALLLGLLAGCSSRPSLSDSGPEPPHKGNLQLIPSSKTYVEIVQKKVASPKEPVDGEVSFYFLKEDGTTPVSPAPTSGTLTVGKMTITLKPQGDGLATPSGPPLFPKGEGVDGMLSVELDGKPMNIPLGVR